jgi:hypothetical protein
MTDKEYYENREFQRIKHAKAISMAKFRGEASEEWHKTNKLTAETLPAFKKAMKAADKEWKTLNK